ncbi:hypothetical protein QN277_027651 [Acacia crassicarpa]|uniref:BZIP domain-containing protein n=1 Tax=Acacia crassicarpa TaxID=499986 RepID=A0AAE1JZ68_9FABA|nr:hypothetical protein QN277_027651 [Acacia crassicarpa]
MEAVWKDMNLSSINDHHGASTADYRSSVILQDFLARSPYDSPSSHDISSSSPSPASPLVTALSLGSAAPPFSFIHPFPLPQPSLPLPPLTPNNPFPSLPCVSASQSFPYTRHFPDSDVNDLTNPYTHNNVNNHSDTSGGERHKRMIKNRESAARSRARKQAYTNELEQKVESLTRENERLRKQQQEWSKASASDKKKKPLFRTSTAPF